MNALVATVMTLAMIAISFYRDAVAAPAHCDIRSSIPTLSE